MIPGITIRSCAMVLASVLMRSYLDHLNHSITCCLRYPESSSLESIWSSSRSICLNTLTGVGPSSESMSSPSNHGYLTIKSDSHFGLGALVPALLCSYPILSRVLFFFCTSFPFHLFPSLRAPYVPISSLRYLRRSSIPLSP